MGLASAGGGAGRGPGGRGRDGGGGHPVHADSRGCNGDLCLELRGSVGSNPITAKIIDVGDNPIAKSYGLNAQHDGAFWSGSARNSATFSTMRIAMGQACATIRWAGGQNGPPGYPCLQLR